MVQIPFAPPSSSAMRPRTSASESSISSLWKTAAALLTADSIWSATSMPGRPKPEAAATCA